MIFLLEESAELEVNKKNNHIFNCQFLLLLQFILRVNLHLIGYLISTKFGPI